MSTCASDFPTTIHVTAHSETDEGERRVYLNAKAAGGRDRFVVTGELVAIYELKEIRRANVVVELAALEPGEQGTA